jgi:ElaA protein
MDKEAFYCVSFAELRPVDLYGILALRQNVFVLEQTCFYADLDGIDLACHHLFRKINGKIISTARLVPPGIVYAEASIGRVCTAIEERKTGEGKMLMQTAIEQTEKLFGKGGIKIGAQLYLEKFYNNFGFIRESEPYDEDGILHIKMKRE